VRGGGLRGGLAGAAARHDQHAPAGPSRADPLACDGVAATLPRDVWAVGGDYTAGPDRPASTLIERWNGTAWSRACSPGAVALQAVTALTVRSACAAGGTSSSHAILRGGGRAWR
jgi:hypothetical protein